ncbi:hypothetical protein SAMN05443634_107119 [Chishuiella changwenlii]|uniref:Uncharacterized protein n=1 Tax=Chishuiella changwenlii TaxID=1434701 RepID=A0A1M6Z0X2_9FLAO|nr:hypothetical protein [Chishuiella changwenlii]GGE87560.1 hypothetical protein GCM10010984_01660 [Chishuiella changwenlii]SHL24005.1 hypothetical protein SAMN05443634_107119 [Chishuiella changwenlii]
MKVNLAYTMQQFQDWFTQQWVILSGRQFDPINYSWLIGPFGNLNGIGEVFINELAATENLIIKRNTESTGLLSSIQLLDFKEDELNNLSRKVIDFYENTSDYELQFLVKWNPFFIPFGYIVNRLFSKRINQLNIPIRNLKNSEAITSEIISLISPDNQQVKYTIWLRKFKSSNRIIYSGVYGTCKLPSGRTCIKAVFPLPKGNATVILNPSVGNNGELILDSSGKKYGDAGFYFLLNDRGGNYWSRFVSTFKDKLVVYEDENGSLYAKQNLEIWKNNVATFTYKIILKND